MVQALRIQDGGPFISMEQLTQHIHPKSFDFCINMPVRRGVASNHACVTRDLFGQ